MLLLQSSTMALACMMAMLSMAASVVAGDVDMRRPAMNSELTVLIYDTETVQDSASHKLAGQAVRLDGVEAYLFGEGLEFEGYGSKYSAVYSMLQTMPADQLIVISDGRDVLLNNPTGTDAYVAGAADEFRAVFNTLTANHPGAVVVSAEAQCCVSALTHTAPGGYYNADGSRNERACSSGEADCLWDGEDKALPWETFMQVLALERNGQNYDDVYLNSGLMAGKAADLLQLIDKAGIGKDEDDQALLTGYLNHNPDAIVLDYGQQMFGNNRGGLGGMEDGFCMFEQREENERLVHSKTHSAPLFLHSPGGFLQCHDDLASKLGVSAVTNTARRRLQEKNRQKGCNYKICFGERKRFLGQGRGIELPELAKTGPKDLFV